VHTFSFDPLSAYFSGPNRARAWPVGWQVTRPPCALPRRLRSYPQGARIVSHPLRRPVYRPGSATDCHFACLGSGRVATTPISPGLGKPHHRRELARLGSVQSGFKGRKELDAPERDVAKGRTRWRSAKLTGESSKWWLSLSQSHAPASRTARRLRISPPHRGGGAQLNRSASAFAIARPCGFSIRHMERGATGSILGHLSSFTIC
jgi:hypothetical protein